MNLAKRVKELEDRLIEVMSAGAIRVKELEDKLNSIQDACEQEIDEWYDNTKHSMGYCPDYDILQGRVEFAEQISNLTE